MKKITLIPLFLILIFAACKKDNLAGNEITGEGLVDFTLLTPISGTNLVLNAALPTQTIDITWNAAKPGLKILPTYKWIAVKKGTANFDKPIITIPSNNAGKDTKLTLTYKQIDDALKAIGIAEGQKSELTWAVSADNSSTKIISQNSFNISITRFSDGATPFSIYGPASSTTNIEINPTSTSDFFKFIWQKSKPANTTKPVKYKIVFVAEGGNIATPLFSFTSGNSGADTSLNVSWKNMSDSLVAHGFTDLSQVAKLEWNVIATSGNFSIASNYVNKLYILGLVKMYLVGTPNGWNINAPFELIADKAAGRMGKVFYSYIKLNGGDEFKFVKTPGNWGSAYGKISASGTGFTTGYNQGGNFQVATTGVYRLTIDIGNNIAYVQQKQVGVVGNMQGWNPGTPIFGGYAARDRFLIVAQSNGTDEFKFHDGPVWDNSAPDKARWWGIGSATGNLDNDGSGGNVVASTSPRTRCIWDGTNPQQVKYNLYPADQMRIVGDGMDSTGVSDWNPASSPKMTYLGNGQWKLNIKLKVGKGIKFLSGSDWGAFDYEDRGDGGTSGSTTIRKISWDDAAGTNFNTPATAGRYNITLDENTQTVTITP